MMPDAIAAALASSPVEPLDRRAARWSDRAVNGSMASSVHLRRAVEADCDAISAIHVRSWQWAYRGLVPDRALDTLTAADRSPDWRLALAPGSAHRIWLAHRADQGIGFAAWGPARDRDARPGTAELYAIYLELVAAGTGVAGALMTAVCSEMACEGYARALLWVLAANPRARRFYERTGWTVDGARKVVTLRGTELEVVRYATVVPRPPDPA
jgi:L-amino acid N-acyltransferase YncA